MKRTLNTAGRTVLFSSITVAVALASLMVFPQRFLYSMGLGGALVALLASAIALTVLPAVLALLGNRVNAWAPSFLQRRAERDATVTQEGFWYRLSRFVMRRPIGIATVTAAHPDRARDPVLDDQVHLGRRAGAARERQRQAGRQRDAGPVPALPRHAEPAAGGERDAVGARRDPARGLAGQGHRGGAAAAAARQRRRRDPGLLRRQLHLRHAAATRRRRSATCRSPRLAAAGRRRRGALRRPPAQPRDACADRPGDRDRRDADRALPDDGLGRAAGQAAGDERPQPERGLRDPGLRLPGRPAGGPARLPQPGGARADDADPAVRGRLRPLDGLRRLPALPDQGGARLGDPSRRRLRWAWSGPGAS